MNYFWGCLTNICLHPVIMCGLIPHTTYRRTENDGSLDCKNVSFKQVDRGIACSIGTAPHVSRSFVC